MAERVHGTEFREDYKQTRYPFADTALLMSRESRQIIAINTFVDAVLYPIGAVGSVFISEILIEAQTATLTLSDRTREALATAEIDLFALPSMVYFYDEWTRPAGILVANSLSLSQFSAWPLGTHTFDADQTAFVASCVKIPTAGGVRGFVTDKNELFSRDVFLFGDNGVELSAVGSIIRVDAVGDPLFRRKECGDAFVSPTFIRTINDCPPDENGNFNITVGDHVATDTILRVVHTADGLQIKAIGS